ncbi:hypothetical protein ACFHW2_42675, partial [Actinomadura sp. LOL_016]|uniref:hypothetical protein n=1 Tax=Actinomadura sp. LOL_016 TaxID=3345411 RepID=UPI003A8B3AD7
MTDENALTMPDAWCRVIHPRRDRATVPAPPAPGRDAAERARGLVDDKRGEIEGVLGLPGTDPETAEAARAHLSGSANPLGAAAVALVSVAVHGLHRDRGDRLFADAWTTDHGAAFAACAFADTGAVRTVYQVVDLSGRRASRRRGAGGLDWTGVVRRRPRDAQLEWWIERGTVRRLRARLAAAPDDVYADAVERLAEHRGHPLQRLIAAYLAPTRQDWVEELCADPGHVAGRLSPVREILDAHTTLPHATDLPPLLTAPPWTRAATKAPAVVVEGLTAPGTRAMAWEPDEREDWESRAAYLWRWADRLDPDRLAARFDGLPGHQQIVVVVKGAEDVVRPLLAGWEPPVAWETGDWMRVIVGRFELDAHDAALTVARENPAGFGDLLMPLRSDEIARTMADWLVRLKTASRTARAWFGRHGAAAAPALVPDALGRAGAARRAAEHALR